MYTTIISAEELQLLIGNRTLCIIDCRFSLADTEAGRRSYAKGHIPGAHYAHLDQDLSGPIVAARTGRHPLPDPERLAARLRTFALENSSQIVAYDDAGGTVAARLWWLGRWLGHDAVAVLDGGFPAWIQCGFPVTVEPPASEPGHFQYRLRSELVVDATDVERMRQSSEARLFDARAEERFRGDVEPIDRVAGHIPGARCLPFADNLDQGRFRPAAELSERFRSALGGVPASRAAVYCGSGVTAAHNILAAAHAGIDGLRLYAGSWSEWINDPERPVAREP